MRLRILHRLKPTEYGCLEWPSKHVSGRPTCFFVDAPQNVYRVLWQVTNRRLLAGDEHLCHHCDNPRCSNLEHIYLGDAKSNVHDAWKRGRAWVAGGGIGTDHWNGRISPEIVEAIYLDPLPCRAAAVKYGVGRAQVNYIRMAKTQRHITVPLAIKHGRRYDVSKPVVDTARYADAPKMRGSR